MFAQTYTVKQGDTLSQIASRYGVPMSSITGYRSGNANQIGVGEVLNIGSSSLPPANTINAGNLNSTPYTAPPTRTSTGYYGLNGLIKNTQDTINGLTPKVDQGQKDFQNTIDSLAGQGKHRVDLYESQGVNAARKELTDIQNTMRAREQSYIAKVDRIRSNNPTGAFASGQEIQIDQATKDHAIERSADAITAEFKLGNYTNAKALVDQLVDAETEDLKTKLEGQKYFLEKNYSQLSDAQKTLLQQQTTETERQYNETKANRNDIASIALKAAQAGATGDDIAKIFKSADIQSATQTAAPFLSGSSGNGNFTNTQINSGAALAGIGIDVFKGFDANTKNFFINGDINGTKKTIDDAFTKEGASLDEVNAEINGMGLPAAGAKYLTDYAASIAKKNAAPTPQETTQTLVTSLKDLQTSGYTRNEAYDAVVSELTDAGKTKLAKTMESSIQDALVTVFGRTFWQRLVPGGR